MVERVGDGGRRWVVANVTRWTVGLALLATAVYPGLKYQYPHYGVIVIAHPWVLHRLLGVYPSPRQVTAASLAMAIHPLGGLFGFYKTLWWWDDVAHLLAGALVAALAYLVAGVYEREGPPTTPKWLPALFAVTTTLLCGIVWEVFELYAPSLTVYGLMDTLTDLLFDVLAALVVVATARWTLDPLVVATDLEVGAVTRILPGVEAEDDAPGEA